MTRATVVRWIRWPLVVVLLAAGLFWPVVLAGHSSAGSGYDPVTFTGYRADFHVGADGRLDAVETITADFPSGRHGIFRYWNVDNAYAPHVRQVPTDISVRLDGQPVRTDLSWEGARIKVARIGDPHGVLTSGSHVFRIQYSVPGVLGPGTTGSAPSTFLWQVVPAWNNYIARADVSVTLPGRVPDAGCVVGAGTAQKGCGTPAVDGDTVLVSVTGLAPHTPVTVHAGVDVPTPPRDTVPWTPRLDRVLGRTVTGVLWVGAAALAAALAAFLWWRSTWDDSPGFPLQCTPPDGIGPVQNEYIRTKRVTPEALIATLFHLAERGLISLVQVNEKRWKIVGLADRPAWEGVDPVSRQVGSALKIRSPGVEVNLNGTAAAGLKLARTRDEIETATVAWGYRERLLCKVDRPAELWLRWAGAVALLISVAAFACRGFPATMWGVPFVAFFLCTIPAWRTGAGLRRTDLGRELWSRAEGFHRMLGTDSVGTRFDFSARKDVYTAYLPFAVAAGIAERWAQKYETDTGTPPPGPRWYRSNADYAGATGNGGNGFGTFESVVALSIAAYASVLSSGGGNYGGGGHGAGYGGGGGGNYGGGGADGGGGSW